MDDRKLESQGLEALGNYFVLFMKSRWNLQIVNVFVLKENSNLFLPLHRNSLSVQVEGTYFSTICK